jgi:BirA family transcriptional regulator, biotin operon repressor / biotin---[acetyl-CoA-carboxylase] ligase
VAEATGSRWADLERPPLDVRALRRALVDGQLWREVRVVDETGSTNADVAALARSGEPAGLVLIAEHQTTGRGRLGRSWAAPARSGLSFSVLLRPTDVPLPAWTLLPLLVGVAVATAVGEVSGTGVRLKWPNDLLIGERKLGGILAERADSMAGGSAAALTGAAVAGAAVVVGVGLNVTLRAAELPVPIATSLALAGATCTDRDPVLRAALRAIAAEYAAWRQAAGSGEDGLLAKYRALCVTLDRDVRIELPGGDAMEGRAVDIGADGCLLVDTAAGRRSVRAGDVVHVR